MSRPDRGPVVVLVSEAEAEQYKLLAADVRHRSIEFLRRGLQALGADPADAEEPPGEEVAPFRKPDQQAAGE